jgi:hypothetical protein
MGEFWGAVFLVLVGAGITAGLATILSPRLLPAKRPVTDPLAPLLQVRVRAGSEQVVIALGRGLSIARRREDVGYGELYLAESSDSHLVIASRSEIGRSFEGEVQLRRLPSSTVVEYFIHSMPLGGPHLESAVLLLERDLLAVLTRLDPAIEVLHARRSDDPADSSIPARQPGRDRASSRSERGDGAD